MLEPDGVLEYSRSTSTLGIVSHIALTCDLLGSWRDRFVPWQVYERVVLLAISSEVDVEWHLAKEEWRFRMCDHLGQYLDDCHDFRSTM